MNRSLLLLLLLAPVSTSYGKRVISIVKRPATSTADAAAISKFREKLQKKYGYGKSRATLTDEEKDIAIWGPEGANTLAVTPPSQRTMIGVGCLLAANSGFLNGMGLSGLLAGRTQAIAAVTGAYTTSALALGAGNTAAAVLQLRVIVSYLCGSLLNGYLNPNGIDWSKKQTSLLLAASLVLVGALDYVATERFFILLALTMGVQNSWTSMLINGNVLRTCHFSGCTSDMGTFLGQVLRGNTENAWKLKIFASLAASFWAGGLFSVVAVKRWTEIGFLGSVGLYLGLWGFFSFRKSGNPKAKMM